MALSSTVFTSWFLLLVIASGIRLSKCTNFTIINNCKETIWPGITASNNFSGGGFALKPTQSTVFTAPSGWNGRIWARTRCDFDKNENGTCQTGSCGSTLKCTGPGQPPASIAEFTVGDIDYYDVSLVDGFNIPVVVKPVNGKGKCQPAGCDNDLRPSCPPELAVKSNDKIIACQSACNAFKTDEYCCRGSFSTPIACVATNYSRTFKTACPAAYSFAYDDPTSIITCSATDYIVSFCSSRNQTQCTYHNKQLVCNGSNGGLEALSKMWKLWLIALPAAIGFPIMF